ncbi:MAG: response regulator [Syntrophobacteria bacterium]|nr:response regulator [Deltaproteobacteria bacterium]MDH3928674.1 response regulator [Deltaproteobacteria bacterium]MDH3964943.1 response regulator [Deltaproteobacteria bacterium]
MDGYSVLLVDDEEEFVSALSERLMLRGIEVEIALDGEEALARMKEKPPDVVILDVMMPGLSGLEVLKMIRGSHPQTQVILLTGQGSTKEGIEGMRLGAFDYLIKPVDIEEMLERMKEAVKAIGNG